MLLTIVLIATYGCGNGTQEKSAHDKQEKIGLLDQQNVLLYLPNSYLTQLFGQLIRNSPEEIYDPTGYQFYSLEGQPSSATTKNFRLRLLKKNPGLFKAGPNSKSAAAIAAQLKAYYAPANFLERKFTLKIIDQQLIGECEGITGQVKLFELPLSDMVLRLADSTFVHQQTGSPKLLFTDKAIISHYSQDEAFVKSASAELDGKVEYQNAGFSAIYPFQFMSNFMDTVNVAYAGRTPLEKGLRIYKVKLKRTSPQQVEARFAINHKLFPAEITGRINFASDQNRILSFPGIGYDQSVSLSQAEKNFMANKVQLVRDSIIPGLLHKSLAPSFTKAHIELRFGEKKISTPVRHSRLSYWGESVIFSIDVI